MGSEAVTTVTIPAEIVVFRQTLQATNQVAALNLEGVTQQESLFQPQAEGNCINWIFGHLVCIYNNVLPLVGEKQVVESARLKRYDRGTLPLKDGKEAIELQELRDIWQEAVERLHAGLGTLSEDDLDAPAPFSPTDNPNETVRSLLGVIGFHQSYHVGQLGILRRIVGKKGAIA